MYYALKCCFLETTGIELLSGVASLSAEGAGNVLCSQVSVHYVIFCAAYYVISTAST